MNREPFFVFSVWGHRSRRRLELVKADVLEDPMRCLHHRLLRHSFLIPIVQNPSTIHPCTLSGHRVVFSVLLSTSEESHVSNDNFHRDETMDRNHCQAMRSNNRHDQVKYDIRNTYAAMISSQIRFVFP